MHQPPKVCSPDAFAVIHKLCARLTRKTPFALYLAVLHVPNVTHAQKMLQQRLHAGEVYCLLAPGSVHILLFAHTDAQAEAMLYPAVRACPGSTLRLQRITQRLDADPTVY